MVSTAIVVLNCELGSTKDIIMEFRKLSEVDEVKQVIGLYDIIMKVSANSVDELKETIKKQIKKTDKIYSCTTMILRHTHKEKL